MIEHFTLERVNKAPASFDPQKLFAFQDRYMQRVPLKQKVSMVLPYLQQAGLVATPPPCDVGPKLTRIVEAAGERIKVAGDILDYADFFTPDEQLPYDEKAFEKRLRKPEHAKTLLAKFRDRLAEIEPFDAAAAEQALKEFCEAEEIKIGDVIHALRVAATGKAVGFGMFETLEILGRDRTLARIERALSQV
jgi:glutamyl-tRNA synthetase